MNIVGVDEVVYNEDGSMRVSWVADNTMRRNDTLTARTVETVARVFVSAPMVQEGKYVTRLWLANAARMMNTRTPDITILEIAFGNATDGTTAKFALSRELRLGLRAMLNQEPEEWAAQAGS